jgi:putative transposase
MEGDVAIKCRDILREIAMTLDIKILAGKVGKDHVHMYVSMPPNLTVARAVMHLKGKSSRKLQMQYTDLRKRYWGHHLWSRGYFASTIGEISDAVIRAYIDGQDEHHKDDCFTVGEESGKRRASSP